MIFDGLDKIRNDRTCKALTGLSQEQFKQLVPHFESAYREIYPYASNTASMSPAKGHLKTFEHKLFFVLYYLKNYPTYDVLGYLFDFSGGHAFDHLEKLLPVLQTSLAGLHVLPERAVETVEALEKILEKQPRIIMDATERATCRPQDPLQQKQRYSGKKKLHSIKNLILVDPAKNILFLSGTVPGSLHDYALCKTEFPPTEPWFKKKLLEVDLGFQGIATDYPWALAIHIPHKTPRKSKKNPNPVLTPAQKKYNRNLAKTRVVVEHAIGGMKSFHSLLHRARNHLMPLLDTFIYLGAGLWNFKLSIKTET